MISEKSEYDIQDTETNVWYFFLTSLVLSAYKLLATDGCELHDYEIHIRTEWSGFMMLRVTEKCWKCFTWYLCVWDNSVKAEDSKQSIMKSTNCKGSNLLAAACWILPRVTTNPSAHYEYEYTLSHQPGSVNDISHYNCNSLCSKGTFGMLRIK